MQQQRLLLLARRQNMQTYERYVFESIAVETFSVFTSSALILLNDLDRRISEISGEVGQTSFLSTRVGDTTAL